MIRSTLLKTVLAAACVLALPGLSAADNDKCRNVRFRFTNEHNTTRPIKVTALIYHDVVNNRDVTKELAALVCEYHATCLTNDKDLADVEGMNIKDVRFVYRYTERDGGWSETVKSKAFNPPDKACRADRIYGPAPDGFVIGGA